MSNKEEIKKLNIFFRILSGFVLLFSVLGVLGVVFFGLAESETSYSYSFIPAIIVPMILIHISGCIVFRGIAPKYLQFAHELKEKNNK